MSVTKAKGVAKSGVLSQASGLRPSSPKVKSNVETKGRKRADISNPDTQAKQKRRKFITALDSDSDNEALYVQLQKLKPSVSRKLSHESTPVIQGPKQKRRRVLVKAKDISGVNPDGIANPVASSNPDEPTTTDAAVSHVVPVEISESSPMSSPGRRHVDMPYEAVTRIAQSIGHFPFSSSKEIMPAVSSDLDPQEPGSQT